jgi:hypothetical protein
LIQRLGSTGIFILICIIIIALIIDISTLSIATSIGGLRPSYITLFVGLVVVFAVGQYYILAFVKREYKDREYKVSSRITGPHIIDRAVTISQYALLAILASVILQMVFTSSYHVFSLKAIIFISYGLSLTLLALLAKRFFSWFKTNHNVVVLVYALAIAMLSINSAITIIYTNYEFDTGPEVIRNIRSLTGGYESSDVVFDSAYTLTSVLSFILMWAATILLMKHYSRRIGKAKYWIAVGIPLAYFLSQFQPLFLYSFGDLRLEDPVLFGVVYNLIFTVAKPAGGILFGIAFWTIAKHLSNQTVKRYMLISAFGMMLLFTANQPTFLVLVPYPPFSLVTISFTGLASYLFYLGIYSASISVSEDARLRQSIRKAAIKESTKFLDSIGTAEMGQEIEKRVIAMTTATRQNMERETGISSSFDEEDIKKYLQEALQEIRGVRNDGNHHK